MTNESWHEHQSAFIQHLQDFHASLSPEERALFEELILRASVAPAAAMDDVSGYSISAGRSLSGPFFSALITQIGFPALDAASKDPAKMTIKITPEYTRSQTTS